MQAAGSFDKYDQAFAMYAVYTNSSTAMVNTSIAILLTDKYAFISPLFALLPVKLSIYIPCR